MAESIDITASLRIERPADVVRAQYRDIDHHIRNNVHPSIRYQWEPGAPGERKIRTTFRILGVPQFDVSLLEDAPDGSFVIRYLEGSNAGMVLVHEFVPLGPEATEVRLSANAPATLGRKILGPLFVAGARQVMKKALAEDKRDLEKGAFVAGTAAGDLERALEALKPCAALTQAEKRALLDAGCLMAAVDGEIEPAERDAIARAARLIQAEGEASWLDQRLATLSELSATEQVSAEAERIGRALSSAGLARDGLTLAAVIGLVSQGLSAGELAALERLSRASRLGDEQLAALVESAEAELSAL
jgi:hypothetical protein